MSVNPEETVEYRFPTPADLAVIVKVMREDRKWSQVLLAEIAKVNERTIQRVENGLPSSFDTRRALAGAFKCKDLDVFNKPLPFPNIDKLKARWAELEKTTVAVPITRIKDARTLRTMVEGSECCATEEFGELSTDARQAFASIVDSLRDYRDISFAYSMTQRLDFDRDMDALLKTIADESAVVGAGLRHTGVRFKSDAPNCEEMDWTIIYIVLAPQHALPSNVRAPKALKLE